MRKYLVVVPLIAISLILAYFLHKKVPPNINQDIPKTLEQVQTPDDIFPIQPHDVKG